MISNEVLEQKILCHATMEMSLLHLVQASLLVEALTLVITVRIIWAQLLPQELDDTRSLPLLVFFFRRRALKRRVLTSQMDMLLGSQAADLKTVLREEKEIRGVVYQYNQLESAGSIRWYFLALIVGFFILQYNPLVLVSCVVSDLVVARIHHHITSSL